MPPDRRFPLLNPLIDAPIRGILCQPTPIRVTGMMRNQMHTDASGGLSLGRPPISDELDRVLGDPADQNEPF